MNKQEKRKEAIKHIENRQYEEAIKILKELENSCNSIPYYA